MGDKVTVGNMVKFDPNALDGLAKHLSTLSDALGSNLRQIRQIINGHGGHLGGAGRIESLISAAQKDAGDMSQRARMAHQVAQKEGSVSLFGNSYWPRLDWQGSSQSGAAARKDASDLNSALSNKDKSKSRRQLLSIVRDMHAHLHDKAYLSTLWNTLDPSVAAKLARTLHNQDASGTSTNHPVILSAESEKIIKEVGSSLAAASSYREKPDSTPENLLSKTAQNGFTTGQDKWSIGMLFKYGPNGKKWDPKFMSAMTTSMLRWHANHSYLPKDPHDAWYASLGLQYAAGSSSLNNSTQRAITEFDPTIAVLDRTSENNDASRWAIQDKNNVHELIRGEWTAPGNPGEGKDLSSTPGAILRSGVTFPRGTSQGAKEAAQGLSNIIGEVKKYHADRLKNKDMKDVLLLPFGLRHSLTQIASSYLPDFAHSASSKDNELGLLHGSDGRPYIVTMNHDDVQAYLDEAVRQSPQDFGWLKGRIKGLITAGVIKTQSGGGSTADYAADAAELFAVLHSVDAVEKIARGHENDVLAAEQKSSEETVKSVISFLPAGYGLNKVVGATGKAFTVSDLYMQAPGTDNEVNARLKAQQDGIKQNFDLPPLIVQGLIKTGQLHPSTREPWLTGGDISSGEGFEDWYKENRNTAINVVMRREDGEPQKPSTMTLEQFVNQIASNYGAVKDWFPYTSE